MERIVLNVHNIVVVGLSAALFFAITKFALRAFHQENIANLY